MHAGARRIDDDHIRPAVLPDEVRREDVLHVAGVELAVVDAVAGGVDFRVLDGLRHVFDADHMLGLAGDELGDGARARVEVVDQLRARQVREFARDLI